MFTIRYFAMLGFGFSASIELSFRAKETSFTEAQIQDTFSRLWSFSCNLSAETNSFSLVPVLLSCLVSELKRLSSPGLEPKTYFSELWSLFLWYRRRSKQLCSWSTSTELQEHLLRYSNPGSCSGFWSLFLWSPPSKQTILFLASFFYRA
jgi:hypothetical protein